MASQWHEYEVVEEFKSDIRGKERLCIEVKCLRCDGHFILEAKNWLNLPLAYNLTRPCPYCFKASYLPGRQHVDRGEYQDAINKAGNKPPEYRHPTGRVRRI